MNYEKQAQDLAKKLGVTLTVKWHSYDYHFDGDKEKRHIFKCTLKKDGKSYTFKFGQSIVEDANEPTMYGVLTCLQKYDVGTFEDFCGEFGYDEDSRSAEKIYKAVLKEWEAMERLFSSDELEMLQEIQ